MYERPVAQGGKKNHWEKPRQPSNIFWLFKKNVLRTVSDLAEHYRRNMEVNILVNHGLRVNV